MPIHISEAFTNVLAGSVGFVISLAVNEAMQRTFLGVASLTKHEEDRDPNVNGATIGFSWLYALTTIFLGLFLIVMLYRHGCSLIKKWFPVPIEC
jgi:hypothetical protein